jgi:hypothetical protein
VGAERIGCEVGSPSRRDWEEVVGVEEAFRRPCDSTYDSGRGRARGYSDGAMS